VVGDRANSSGTASSRTGIHTFEANASKRRGAVVVDFALSAATLLRVVRITLEAVSAEARGRTVALAAVRVGAARRRLARVRRRLALRGCG